MIQKIFEKKHPLFIPFIMAGHPTLALSTQALITLAEIGSDIIELGIPFSDPIADGPVNQKAAATALINAVTLSDILIQVNTIRNHGYKTPILLFCYFNSILAFGCKKFCEQAKAAGVNGILIVDLPPEEGEAFYHLAQAYHLDIVLLVSPTTNPNRLPLYKKLEPSFIYYISRLSVTGIQKELSKNLETELHQLRSYLPDTKIVVGFGISTAEQVKQVAQIADGVVVGSKLVTTLETLGIDAFRALSHQLATAAHAITI